MNKTRLPKLSLLTLVLAALMFLVTLPSEPVQAVSLDARDFNPGRIIDDDVFTDDSTMSVEDIQKFLEQHIPGGACDRYKANHYNTYHTPPYTCLFEFQQNPETKETNYGLFDDDGSPTSIEGGQTAAEIIWQAAQTHGINPQVLIVLLQKEQSLVTDTWPWVEQYGKATGYACPDDDVCNPKLADFHSQVHYAAWQFKYYLENLDQYWYIIGNNSILYHPRTACGSTVVNIQNRATAALYLYTPYVPNQAALDNLYGTGDNCSSYGNRNFWSYFNRWFGASISGQLSSSTVPVSRTVVHTGTAFELVEQNIYNDTLQTVHLGHNETKIERRKQVFITLEIKNVGTTTWTKDSGDHQLALVTLGDDSLFCDPSWLDNDNCQQIALLNENVVNPGEIGSFHFIVTAPKSTGFYSETFAITENNRILNKPTLTTFFEVDKRVPYPQSDTPLELPLPAPSPPVETEELPPIEKPVSEEESTTEEPQPEPETTYEPEPQPEPEAPTTVNPRPNTAILPDNWHSLSVIEKILANPWGCHDTTKIRADNGRCLSGGYTIPDNSRTPINLASNNPNPRPNTAILPDNWHSLSVIEKILANPWGCHDTTKIRADNGRCLSGGYTIPDRYIT